MEVALTQGEAWALKMLDADGKLGPGFLQGNVQWVGRYSECVSQDVAQAVNGSVFYIINFAIHLNVPSLSPEQVIPAKLGSCFPQACNGTEVGDVMNKTLLMVDALLAKYNISQLG